MSTMQDKSEHIPVEMKAHNSPWTELFHAAEEKDSSSTTPAAQQPETSQPERAERTSDSAGDSANPTRDALSTIFNGH